MRKSFIVTEPFTGKSYTVGAQPAEIKFGAPKTVSKAEHDLAELIQKSKEESNG